METRHDPGLLRPVRRHDRRPHVARRRCACARWRRRCGRRGRAHPPPGTVGDALHAARVPPAPATRHAVACTALGRRARAGARDGDVRAPDRPGLRAGAAVGLRAHLDPAACDVGPDRHRLPAAGLACTAAANAAAQPPAADDGWALDAAGRRRGRAQAAQGLRDRPACPRARRRRSGLGGTDDLLLARTQARRRSAFGARGAAAAADPAGAALAGRGAAPAGASAR